MRTKRMIFTTLFAIVVITAAMMSTALAAPASTNCPLKSALTNSLINGTTSAAPTSNCPTKNLLNQLLGTQASNPATGTTLCPKQQALLNLLNGTNSTTPTTGTTNCPAKALLQNLLGGNTNLSSLLSGLK